MVVELDKLRPNPMRDFEVDPIDAGAVEKLKKSIQEDGFWGGVVCRQNNGYTEIAAGHHRVRAALEAGISKADLFVAKDGAMDDDAILRVYARENATQRGAATGTSRAGSVAAAVRLGAYKILTGDISRIREISPKALQCAQGNLTSKKGIGADIVEGLLKGVPEITDHTIRQDLASLKKSGDYARLIAGVRDRIAFERRQAERAAEEAREAARRAREQAGAARTEAEAQAREAEATLAEQAAEDAQRAADNAEQAAVKAEAAADKSAEETPTFDFKGVALHLNVPSQIEAFRDKVTSEVWRSHLTFDDQAAVAKQLVELAAEREQELTALFIRDNLTAVMMALRDTERRISRQEQERVFRADWQARSKDLLEHFAGAMRNLDSYGSRFLEHLESRPDGEPIVIRASVQEGLRRAKIVVEALYEAIGDEECETTDSPMAALPEATSRH